MIRTEQFLDGSHSANVVRELQRSMNANACQKLKPTLEKRVTDIYMVECGNGDLGSGWQNRILYFVECSYGMDGRQGISGDSDNNIQQGHVGYVGKFIRRKGGADENHQNEVNGQVIEVVELFVALA